MSGSRSKKRKASEPVSDPDDDDEDVEAIKPCKKKRRKATKKEILAETGETSKKIHATHGEELEKFAKAHQSWIYAGKTEEIVEPDTEMSPKRSLTRHIATALLIQNTKMVEVQVAISDSDKTIYVACNTQERSFPKTGKTLADFPIPSPAKRNKRVARHLKKLEEEIEGDYGDYKIKHVRGMAAKHAETKIVDAGYQFDYIGGTRRPCLACSLYFQIKKVNPNKFNPHAGPFWDAQAALLSLHGHTEGIKKTDFSGVFYKNKGRPTKAKGVTDYDTDSEDESAEDDAEDGEEMDEDDPGENDDSGEESDE